MSTKNIDRLLKVTMVLVGILAVYLIIKMTWGATTDEALAMKGQDNTASIEDSVLVEIPTKDVSVICTIKKGVIQECKVVRFKGFLECLNKFEVKPEPTVTVTPMIIPTPAE
jgi:hypothetical protein